MRAFFALLSQGTVPSDPTFEGQDEATADTLYGDISGAIEFIGELVRHVVDGTYDEQNEETCSAFIGINADGSRFFKPIKGFKEYPNLLEDDDEE